MTIRPQLKHFYAFGCPTYQLNRSLQGKKSQPKGKQHTQPVIYLGSLPKHTSLVALVLDFLTAPVSLQFHLKFDDLFETFSPSWQHFERVKKEPFRALESSDITPRQGDHIGCADLPVELLIEHDSSTLQPPLPPDDSFGIDEDQRITPEGAIQFPEHIPTPSIAVESVVARWLGCNRRPTQRFAESQQQLAEGIVSYFTAHEAINPKIYQEDLLLKELEMDPISFKATANPDTLYLHEAMEAPEAAQFKEAVKKEALQTEKGHWEVIQKLEVPVTQKYCLLSGPQTGRGELNHVRLTSPRQD
jgi:hypothetical protein